MLAAQRAASTRALPASRVSSVASVRCKPVRRRTQVVSQAAAPEGEAAPAPTSQRTPRQPRVYKVQLENLKEGDILEGTVTTVENYGAFVDFGARSSGLVHISKLGAGFVSNARDVVKVGQAVVVRVLQVDAEKGRVSLELQGAERQAGGEDDSDAGAADDVLVEEQSSKDSSRDREDDDDDLLWGVDLEPGQIEVRADLRGYDDIPIILEESNANEITESGIAEMEADLDGVELKYELDAPPYLEEVNGKVFRVENYGVLVEFQWQGQRMTGLLSKDEMKLPYDRLDEERKAALVEEWAVTGYLPPAYVAIDDMEWNVSDYYQTGDSILAFALDGDMEGRGLNLTHFTDEEIAADGVDAYEEDEEEDDELLELLVEGGANEEALASAPEDLAEDEDEEAEAAVAAAADDDTAGSTMNNAARGGILRNKDGQMVYPLGLPSRETGNIPRAALATFSKRILDGDGDEVDLEDFWSIDYVVPKNALRMLGAKMIINEAGEAEVVPREDFKGQLPDYHLHGDLDTRARAFVEDLTADDADDDLPIFAMRRPIVLAAAVASISAATVKELREKTGAGMMDCKKALTENEGDMDKATEWLRKKGLAGADKKAGRVAAEGAIHRYIHPGSRLGVLLEVNCETDFVAASEKFIALTNELGMIIASTDCVCVTPEEVPPEMLAKEREVEMGKEDLANKPEAIRAKIVEGRLEKIKNQMALMNQSTLSDPNKTVADLVKETIAAVGENIKVRRFLKYRLGEGIEKRSSDFAAEVAQQTQAKAPAPKKEEAAPVPPKEAAPAKATVQVSASVVKELRELTGAGMMDCKKALAENEGDMERAQEWLRQKGLAGADKKAGRIAAEGVVAAYIHPGSRLGVLLEVNCETDFVAASEKFNQLVQYIAMGIAAAQGVQYVSAEDIPAEVFEREKQLEMAREDLKNKPDAIRAKIAEGRARKIGEEMALLNQPYLVDQSKTIAEAIKEAIAAIGEKISVRRFSKFTLGEGIEKKSTDFAAEVAAVTGQK